jgi:hypothetical protein
MALRFLQKSGLLLMSVAWLSGGRLASASETIHLDPNAKPTPPPATASAVISEESSDRACTVQMVPNGVLIMPRPCALDDRIGRARLWSRDAGSISLLEDNGLLLFRFEARGPRVYRTRDAKPPQLVLSLLPEASQPMGQ